MEENYDDIYEKISYNESYDILEPTISKDNFFDIQYETTLEETSEKTNDYPVRCLIAGKVLDFLQIL